MAYFGAPNMTKEAYKAKLEEMSNQPPQALAAFLSDWWDGYARFRLAPKGKVPSVKFIIKLIAWIKDNG